MGLTRELRVVYVTNNLEANPECAADTAEFPDLVKYIEDECATLVVDPADPTSAWPADEFFMMEKVTRFLVDPLEIE